jgi:broad specificity phosphatase PhoE
MNPFSRVFALGTISAAAFPLAAQQVGPVATTVYLVRHAEKVADGTADPHLAPAGESRARALEVALRDSSITTVVVTQWRRTRETAAPFLASHSVTLTTIPVAGNTVPAYADSVAAIVRRASGRVLIVSHSNTVPALIAALGGPRGIVVCDAQNADLFILHRSQGDSRATMTRSHYGTPDPPGAERCP